MKADWITWVFTGVFGTLACWFAWIAGQAVLTGRFVAKSPKYPTLRADEPVFFWIGVLMMVGLAGAMLWLVYTFWTSGPDQNE